MSSLNALNHFLMDERDRWFLWIPVLFAIGIATYFSLLTEPSWMLVGASISGILVLRFKTQRTFTTIGVNGLLVILAGFAMAQLRTEWVRAPILAKPLRAAVVTGIVERSERRPDKSMRLTIRVVHIADLAKSLTPTKVRIWMRRTPQPLRLGEAIRVTARLTRPPSPTRPQGYDFARTAYFKGIGAVGFARSSPIQITLKQDRGIVTSARLFLENARRNIGDRIESALPGEVGKMANALMTGERSGISQATNNLYRAAGIFHILSISGLHMAIMGGSVFVVCRLLFALIPAIALRYPIKKWAAVSAAIATFAYLLISGGAHPTVRSFIMIVIMFLAILLDRPALALRNVAIAALIILAITPESLFNAGFQLSFAAVVGLISAYEAFQARQHRRRQLGLGAQRQPGPPSIWRTGWLFMAGTIATTIIAGLATAPFAAFHFHTSQIYSVLTNMLAIPVSNLVVMPAALIAFIVMPSGYESVPLRVMGLGIETMTWAAAKVTALPGAVIPIPVFSETALQLMIGGGLWLCLWRGGWRWFGILGILLGIYTAQLTPQPAALIGRNGKQIALREHQGRFTIKKQRYSNFQLRNWLESDGDSRNPLAAINRTGRRSPFRCDLDGCIGLIGKHLIAMPRSPSALIDDCRRADLLVLPFPVPAGCVTQAKVLDYRAMKTQGTHALYLERNGSIRTETVEQYRGNRPWTLRPNN